MTRPNRPHRWVAFGLASLVLMAGLVLLSAQAADSGLAPPPDPETAATGTDPTATATDSPVVDRLGTWAETKGKKRISPVRGGGKNR